MTGGRRGYWAEVLSAWAEGPDEQERIYAAWHPWTPPPVLGGLLLERCHDVQLCAAGNPYVPPAALAEVVMRDWESINDASIADDAADHPNMPPEALGAMMRHRSYNIRVRASSHPSAPPDALAAFAADPDNDDFLIECLAMNPATPTEVLARLAAHPALGVRGQVAGNPATPPEVLADLAAETGNRYVVRDRVASNPATPPEVLADLAKAHSREPRRRVALNPSTPTEILDRLILHKTASVSDAAEAAHPATPLRRLAAIAGDLNGYFLHRDDIYRRLLLRDDIGPSVLRSIAASCRTPVSRRRGTAWPADAVAAHQNVSVSLALRLAAHPDPDVRAAVASRAGLPPGLLARLANDEDPWVAEAALSNPDLAGPEAAHAGLIAD